MSCKMYVPRCMSGYNEIVMSVRGRYNSFVNCFGRRQSSKMSRTKRLRISVSKERKSAIPATERPTPISIYDKNTIGACVNTTLVDVTER